MKVITAPEPLKEGKSLFLGGGITGCWDWQSVMLEGLKNLDILVFNPRRNFAPQDAEEQICWEIHALKAAKAISFWFSHETIQPITLFELGRWTAKIAEGKPVFVGVDPGYERRKDIEIQLRVERPEIKVVCKLSDLIGQVKEWAK